MSNWAGFQDHAVHLYAVPGYARLHTFPFADQGMAGVAVAPDGRAVAAVGSGGTVQVWDVAARTGTVLRGHADLVEAVAFHPAGGRLATAGTEGTVRLWGLAAPDRGRTFGPRPVGEMARRLAVTAAGRYPAAANFRRAGAGV